jgi:poly-gamma-glutamate synthesis protein (capsule biosynthesis protein)
VAFLAYTENINGYSVPEDSSIQIVLTSQEDLIREQITKAKELADVVIVSAHWGVEDTFEVTEGVQAQAQNMIEWGADVIIGNHPHVPQTMEYCTRSDGTQGFVFYSLGNFVSAQTFNINIVGEVADFNLAYDGETGQVTVEDIQVRPVITQYDDGALSNLRLIAYKDYTEELAAEHGLPYAMSGEYGVWSMEKIQEIIDTAIPEEYQKLD